MKPKPKDPYYHYWYDDIGDRHGRIFARVCDVLERQQSRLDYLCIIEDGMIPLMAKRNWGLCQVKTLDLSQIVKKRVSWTPSDGDNLEGILSRLGSRGLEELRCKLGVKSIMRSLSKGACPELRRLVITPLSSSTHGTFALAACEALANAMIAGHCKRLQALVMTGMKPDGFTIIAGALRAGSCPDLEELDTKDCVNTLSDWQALSQVLRSGSCPQLKILNLEGWQSCKAHLLTVMDALQQGSCPELTHLAMRYYSSRMEEPIALANLVISGCLPNFQSLDLQGTANSQALLKLLETIHGGQTPNLRRLILQRCQMDYMHAKVLGEALKAGICPQLESLSISNNSWMDDKSVANVVQGLEEGYCPEIKELSFEGTNMGQATAVSIASMLA